MTTIGLVAATVIVVFAIDTLIAVRRQTTAYMALEQKLMQTVAPIL